MTRATPEAVPSSKPEQHRRIVKAGRPLSKKELEVLRWATQGKTVWEISVIRAISPATVKFHLSNIYAKLGIGSQSELLGLFIRELTENELQAPSGELQEQRSRAINL